MDKDENREVKRPVLSCFRLWSLGVKELGALASGPNF